MNNSTLDILQALLLSPAASQRTLARETGYSLGLVNRALQELSRDGYLEEGRPSSRALQLAQRAAPQRAVILAAGPGMHMVPINTETPKALLRVHGEVLIERLIRQLHEAGVEEIHVVVGYLKEQLEYLTEDFGVKLLVAPDYASKNNLHSLRRAADYLEDAYILPCDLWFAENPFRRTELYSWYMVTDRPDPRSPLRVHRRHELRLAAENEDGNTPVGVCYLTAADAGPLRERLAARCRSPRHDGDFWEAALPVGRRIPVAARVVPAESVAEINTYEQLREIDSDAENLRTDAIDVICGALSAAPEEITQIRTLKKGMTNRSFLFRCRGRRYIMRIPGEGTQQLINRREEADVYAALAGRGISDDILYINPENGYKISAFLEGARECDRCAHRMCAGVWRTCAPSTSKSSPSVIHLISSAASTFTGRSGTVRPRPIATTKKPTRMCRVCARFSRRTRCRRSSRTLTPCTTTSSLSPETAARSSTSSTGSMQECMIRTSTSPCSASMRSMTGNRLTG